MFKIIIAAFRPVLGFEVGAGSVNTCVEWFFVTYHSDGTAIDSSVLQYAINKAATLKQARQCNMVVYG